MRGRGPPDAKARRRTRAEGEPRSGGGRPGMDAGCGKTVGRQGSRPAAFGETRRRPNDFARTGGCPERSRVCVAIGLFGVRFAFWTCRWLGLRGPRFSWRRVNTCTAVHLASTGNRAGWESVMQLAQDVVVDETTANTNRPHLPYNVVAVTSSPVVVGRPDILV
jgi:hypothetical protein